MSILVKGAGSIHVAVRHLYPLGLGAGSLLLRAATCVSGAATLALTVGQFHPATKEFTRSWKIQKDESSSAEGQHLLAGVATGVVTVVLHKMSQQLWNAAVREWSALHPSQSKDD